MSEGKIQPLDISLAVPGLPFDGNSAVTASLGGSETAGYYMARELARLGHHVRLFCNCTATGMKPGTYDGVQYYPLAEWKEFAHFVPHDLAIVERAPDMFSAPTQARLNWLWCHDLALGRLRGDVMGVMWNVDRVLVLSEYMREQYRTVYGIPDAALLNTRNGIDTALFAGLDGIQRHRNRLVYTARPERGLDNLLRDIFPMILREAPDVELHLAGYQNQVEHLREFYQSIDWLIRSHGDRVVWHGALGKRQLYELYASCGQYVYPTPSEMNAAFAEISCITAMEAQACGLPIVTSDRGALIETIAPEAGALISGDPWTDDYRRRFTDAVLHYLRDDAAWKEASAAGKRRAQWLDWGAVAKHWSEEAETQLRALSGRVDTLAHHFWRHSDIMAARELINRNPGAVDPALVGRIETDWAFTKSDDAYREQYEKIGLTHGPNIGHEVNEPRFKLLQQRLEALPEAKNVIDYGCAYGNYLLNIVPRLPGRQWIGLDVDKHSIELANKHAQKLLTEEQRKSVRLMTADLEGSAHFSEDGSAETRKADALILFEVLEHVMEPSKLVDRVEKLVEKDGRVLITVPYGPWEYDSYHTYPHRCHLWEFDWHDLRDIFGGKKEVLIAPIFYGLNQFGEPLGWWLVEYRVDPERPTGTVDMDRKLWLQRPRQTVSATLIAGPDSEDNLHWCLKSLRHFADELILVDCGMSPEAVRIADQHGAWYRGQYQRIQGPDPKEAGFETPRNIGLDRCSKDFVLWLDTDEKLLGSESMHKYLRHSVYNGFCVKQCHFACDTTFNPDTPVRLFRNPAATDQTKGMRFFGMIHEHPEMGLNNGPGIVITISDAWIPHVGYLNEPIRRRRFSRNLPLLQRDIEKYPDRVLQKHFLMRDKMLLCMHEIQANGGRMTAEIQARAREVIEMYRKYFRDKSVYQGLDTIQYYSQACQILGLGAEVGFQVAAAKTGSPQVNGTRVYRFANMEDLEVELLKVARSSAEQFMSEVW